MLAYLGFSRTQCPFQNGDGYCRMVAANCDPKLFADTFESAYASMESADRHFNACGFQLPQPEGWGIFSGKASHGNSIDGYSQRALGDGHTAPISKHLSEAEDGAFRYRYSWIEDSQHKGWITHYQPKHLPLSAEMRGAFKYFGIRSHDSCPEFDFEPCFWFPIPFESNGSALDSNAGFAHKSFNSHAEHFGPALECLLKAHSTLEPLGMELLDMPHSTAMRRNELIRENTITPANTLPSESFDVALSFAGSNREQAEQLALMLREAGFSVFYDSFYPDFLWGKNLVELFDDIYRKRSRYCVMFISAEYADRIWTNHERKAAQARALEEKGNEYILPIKVDETELPGMLPTVGHVSLSEHGIAFIADLLIKKLRA